MLLMSRELHQALHNGHIVQKPADPSLISVNSVDVAVGSEGWIMGAHHDVCESSEFAKSVLKSECAMLRNLYVGAHDPRNPANVLSAIKRSTVGNLKSELSDWIAPADVPNDTEVLLLKTGESYLLSTLHEIGTKPQRTPDDPVLVPVMKAKSTAGRLGLTVSLCAGVGDYGYHSRWALECRVAATAKPTLVPLVVGTVIAQVMFFEGTQSGMDSSFYGGSGSYQETPGRARFLPKALRVVTY
jgi:deoxycytidine triphosphate deaminase